MRKFLKILFLPFGLMLIAIVAILRVVLRPIAALANIASIILIFTGVIFVFLEIKGSSIADYSDLYKWMTLAFALFVSIFGLILPFVAAGVLVFTEFVLKQITLFTFDFSSKKEREFLKQVKIAKKTGTLIKTTPEDDREKRKTSELRRLVQQAQKEGIEVIHNLDD